VFLQAIRMQTIKLRAMREEEENIPSEDKQELFEHYRIEVDKGQGLLRIDKYLMHRIENASRSKIQAAAEAGCILVNGKPVKSSYRIKPEDLISVVLPDPPRDTTVYPEDIPLDIPYEDDDLLIVNKAAGMVVHPGFNNYTGTLVNALVHHFSCLPVSRNGEQRPGLVHRIDKDTSGLIVISKNEFAMTFLARQFFDHSIERKYQALVWGDLKEDAGTVSGNIGRNPKDRLQMTVFAEEGKGKPAVTHWKVLERFGYVTLVECRLETGRTHQIRAHMRHIGNPLFSDAVYGGNEIPKAAGFPKFRQFVANCFEVMPRQALHAKSLGFIHPGTKEAVHFESDLPADFRALLEKWRKASAGWGEG
jgi:23S rRNA pseudouridine1911/1915/1917 synthase